MGATFSEVKRMARRANHEDNRKTMFFASRVSIYITYLLSKTRASANGVTYVFTCLGVVSSIMVYLPYYWAPFAAFMVYRFHVVLDVVDGELARYRQTCSPAGAYLDYLTHYGVYSTASFGFGVHYFLLSGDVSSIFLAFAVSIGLVLNMASKDCWYRANFGKTAEVEGRDRVWRPRRVTLLAVRLCSVNSVWFLYAAASLAARAFPGSADLRLGSMGVRGAAWLVLACYAVVLPVFSLMRIIITARTKKIPRRAAWY